MTVRSIRRGQPLVALLLVMSSWVGARVMLWEAPAFPKSGAAMTRSGLGAGPIHSSLKTTRMASARSAGSPMPQGLVFRKPSREPHLSSGGLAPLYARPHPEPVSPFNAGPVPLPPVSDTQPAPRFVSARVAGGHQLLWLAAVAQLPLPADVVERSYTPERPDRPDRIASPSPAKLPHWSADGWILLRRGAQGFAPGSGVAATYGASQVGAVVRYRLSSSSLQPRVYLRASSAVDRPRDAELAVGLAVRPVKALPVVAQAEARVLSAGAAVRVRPAAMLVSALNPVELPLGLRAETYAAAGYIGGKDATGFAEGQVRVNRVVARLGEARLRLGVGAWAGAQKGASRADMGPSATIGLPMGSGNASLSADWRFRIAGQASPDSGPALTISAGF